jgi:hypothetical protein
MEEVKDNHGTFAIASRLSLARTLGDKPKETAWPTFAQYLKRG